MQLRLAPALALAALLLAGRPAGANEYEIFIDVETEEDLYDLRDQGEIDDQTFETLVELHQRGVDLNESSRAELYTLPNLSYRDVDAILAYRDEVGFIRDPAELVLQQVLSEEKVAAIAPFLLVRDPGRPALAADGWVRTQTRWSAEDDGVPPFAFQGRVATLDNLRAGVAVIVTRNRLDDVVYDPSRDALTADPAATRPNLAKAYVSWDTEDYGVIAGTYRVGFGQRLTFDNTSQITPGGFYPDDELLRSNDLVRLCKESEGELDMPPCPRVAGGAGNIFVTPDYKWTERLLGVAASLKKVELDTGFVQSHGFVSYQPRSIYQYELYDRAKCEDPHDDDSSDPENEDCSAPDVFRRQQDPFDPTSRFSFHSLPDMYTELTFGGNTTYYASRRAHVGVTGYRSSVDFLTEGIDLDFQEWSSRPFGGPFGAIGVDGAYGVGNTDVFAEVARSFDQQPDGGGGFGALLRSVTSWGKRNEVETSLRYYDKRFANPYARPIAAPDEFDGNRARDEAGARVRYTGMATEKLRLRTNVDVWHAPSEGATDTLLYARGDVQLTPEFRWGLWTAYQNKDLAEGGRDECFEISTEEDETGEPIPCAGEKYRFTARVRFEPSRTWWLTGQYKHEFLDEAATMTRPHFDDEFRQDASATLIFTAKPVDPVRVRVRTRYLFEDIKDNEHLEQTWWSYADFSYRIRERDRLRLRYDLFVYLDDRDSSLERVPAPEHWLWLEYQSRF